MSAGTTVSSAYENNFGAFFPVRIQPETLTLTLGGQANDAPVGPAPPNTPSAKISGGQREAGMICRKVRFRFSGATIPPGYKVNGILTLPVLTPGAYNAWGKGSTGTYTLEGTAYDVAFVGKSPEKIN